MKKNIVALVVVALVASFSLFAVADANLNLSTHISGINYMALTATELTTSTVDAYDTAAGTIVGSKEITSATATGTIAYLSILSNNRKGFEVAISATPLASSTDGNSYKINYVVHAGTASFDTSANATNTSNKLTGGVIAGLKAYSFPVSVAVNGTEYAAALEDTYRATVTFAYTAK
ncbi:hypothetical protein SpiGrapes_1376 [Sphaerochaeta pleomorpha str. Grapes]|uniref:Uncharacterized protein n=1 Tax=Sphaerochaeta pleomorpha (strain ATCC BAA-1885 / DSM 22778 / Grapes) TaxID=158190 RepID=G8QUF5_SPHPG|nr:hypothetical protein [Sphaerochaeta pleomorpha]AEV29188.1 hypothetical protein SpiGrapes_1376 [Sphaerochaeta pleomorpha str. Grapes]